MRAVSFDLWHTLLHLPPRDEDAYLGRQLETLARLIRESPLDGGISARADPEVAASEALAAAVGRVGVGAPLSDLARDAARRAGRVARPREWVDAVEELVDAQPFEEVAGARRALAALKDRGFAVVVVSNLLGETGASMRRVLERLGMAEFLDGWASSDELPWAKPSPEIFWHALRQARSTPSETVHIGDLPVDVEGARAAGLKGALLFRGARSYGAHYARLFPSDLPPRPPAPPLLERWADLPSALNAFFPSE